MPGGGCAWIFAGLYVGICSACIDPEDMIGEAEAWLREELEARRHAGREPGPDELLVP